MSAGPHVPFEVPVSECQLPVVMAIDVGTSSMRTLLFDGQGRCVEGIGCRESHAIPTAADGAAETDPAALLERALRCIDAAVAQCDRAGLRIAAVCSCSFVSNIMAVDADGAPLTPLMIYADTRPATDALALRAELDEADNQHRTGCRFHSSYLPARVRWLARTNPAVAPRVRRWITFGEYLEETLFGGSRLSVSAASWTGLLNRHSATWDSASLEFLGLDPEQLGAVTDTKDAAEPRPLLAQFAQRWPSLCGVPWFPMFADGACANIGSSCWSPARIAVTIGTTSAIRAVTRSTPACVPAGLWCYRVDAGRSLPGGALTEGGSLFAWMRDALVLPPADKLEAELAAMEPCSHGLAMLPLLSGERSPGWADHARGALNGISLSTTPVQIVRAGLEAVALRLAIVYGLLESVLASGDDAGGEISVVASGGALLSSPAWLQILADALERPVTASRASEASARGAALLALEAIGALPDLAQAPPILGDRYDPVPGRYNRYREALEHQKQLYELLVLHRT